MMRSALHRRSPVLRLLKSGFSVPDDAPVGNVGGSSESKGSFGVRALSGVCFGAARRDYIEKILTPMLLQFALSGILLAEPQNDHYDQWNGDEHAQGNLVGSGELHQAKY